MFEHSTPWVIMAWRCQDCTPSLWYGGFMMTMSKGPPSGAGRSGVLVESSTKSPSTVLVMTSSPSCAAVAVRSASVAARYPGRHLVDLDRHDFDPEADVLAHRSCDEGCGERTDPCTRVEYSNRVDGLGQPRHVGDEFGRALRGEELAEPGLLCGGQSRRRGDTPCLDPFRQGGRCVLR